MHPKQAARKTNSNDPDQTAAHTGSAVFTKTYDNSSNTVFIRLIDGVILSLE